MIPLHHIDGAIDKVPETVCQVTVITDQETFNAKVGIVSGGNIPDQIIPKRVRSVLIGQLRRVNDIAQALAHLRPFYVPPTMDRQTRHLLVWKSHSVQHDRPINTVSGHHDIFADDVCPAWPQIREIRKVAAWIRLIASEGYIVEQRIKPNIGDVFVIKRELNTPEESLTRARDAEIAAQPVDSIKQFNLAKRRGYEIRMGVDKVLQPILV